jgi:hypothetical protein
MIGNAFDKVLSFLFWPFRVWTVIILNSRPD